MSDFTRNFFIDPGIIIKEESLDGTFLNNITASVPIPTRRIFETSGNYDYENSQSPLYQQDNSLEQMQTRENFNSDELWQNRLIISGDNPYKNDTLIHMDDDDIFQVDKADLIQGPTLAELNANDENLLGDLNFDDLLLPEEGCGNSNNSYLPLSQKSNTTSLHIINLNNNETVTASSSCPQSSLLFYKDLDSPTSMPFSNYPTSAFSPATSQTSSNSPQMQSSPSHNFSALQQKHSTLHELLMKRENYVSPERNQFEQSPSGSGSNCGNNGGNGVGPESCNSPNTRSRKAHQSRLSSSAPTHLGLEQLWQRREPRQHLISTSSMVEAESTSSLSTGGILSPDPQDFSNEEYDSDEGSDADQHYEDMSSDDSDREHSNKHSQSKKERFFWQYNVQAKGPKGQRLVMKTKMEDPHILNEITDPVFSPDCSVRGIKHSGKARKGDGNDLTPNARKLFSIGKELDKLGRVINDMTPVSELPFNVRPKSRKEKNKLASRACRLKKKAQHEANKIKLSGLEIEHKNLINGIAQCKEIMMIKLQEQSPAKQEELSMHLEKLYKIATRTKIAGYTTEYVNKILEKLEKGQNLHEEG